MSSSGETTNFSSAFFYVVIGSTKVYVANENRFAYRICLPFLKGRLIRNWGSRKLLSQIREITKGTQLSRVRSLASDLTAKSFQRLYLRLNQSPFTWYSAKFESNCTSGLVSLGVIECICLVLCVSRRIN